MKKLILIALFFTACSYGGNHGNLYVKHIEIVNENDANGQFKYKVTIGTDGRSAGGGDEDDYKLFTNRAYTIGEVLISDDRAKICPSTVIHDTIPVEVHDTIVKVDTFKVQRPPYSIGDTIKRTKMP